MSHLIGIIVMHFINIFLLFTQIYDTFYPYKSNEILFKDYLVTNLSFYLKLSIIINLECFI